jgi:DNA (cytosine-5)-methyltransferase 1
MPKVPQLPQLLEQQLRYYNDNDPKVIGWLRSLENAGLIGSGVIDNRSIKDVKPDDLTEFTRCHFFAGIGGWEYALHLGGWPENKPVWTGSCPCQPFSCSGKQRGEADERHLWPEFRRLISECHPSTIFGEQVASKLGREWLSRVRADLEALGYAVGAADLCAAGEGAPHIRQRLYWVADSEYNGSHESNGDGKATEPQEPKTQNCFGKPERGGRLQTSRLANAKCGDKLYNNQSRREGVEPEDKGRRGEVEVAMCGSRCRLADTTSGNAKMQTIQRSGFNRLRENGGCSDGTSECGKQSETKSHWSECRTVQCQDSKTCRVPTEPAFFPLADGLPGRVVQLRGLGNAIVPQVAATFITAFKESIDA